MGMIVTGQSINHRIQLCIFDKYKDNYMRKYENFAFPCGGNSTSKHFWTTTNDYVHSITGLMYNIQLINDNRPCMLFTSLSRRDHESSLLTSRTRISLVISKKADFAPVKLYSIVV